jgi:non-ribosomal peptide synthetase component F
MLIPDEVVNFVKERQEEWSSGDFLLAAYGTLIARLGETNSFDIAYSDSDLKREFAGLDKLFAIHLPLRLNIDCSQSFAEILKAVKKQLQSVREHSSYPMDVVARYPELRSIRESSGTFALPLVVEKGERVNVNDLPAGTEVALNISENGQECRWIYDRNKLGDDDALRLCRHFTTFLCSIVNNPNQPVASLSLLTEEERHQVLVQWNDNHLDYPKDQCFHQLFEEQALRTPDANALIFGERRLTYLELNQRANRLAYFLRSLGVGPDIPVAICVERSLEMVIGLLAVLKAGAAYLPLDPAYPRERLAYMLRDSDARVLLTQHSLVFRFNDHTIRKVCLDTDWKVIAKHSERNAFSEVNPENLAYIIYTSGSTGHPKGVLIPHSALVSHSVSIVKQYELDPSDRVLQFASISFDVAAEELLASLLSGAAVVLPTWKALPSLSGIYRLA